MPSNEIPEFGFLVSGSQWKSLQFGGTGEIGWSKVVERWWMRVLTGDHCCKYTTGSSEHTHLQPHLHRIYPSLTHPTCPLGPSEHSLPAFFFCLSHVCKVDGFPEFWGPHSSLSLTGQGLLCMCESRGPLSGKRVVAPGRQLHVISQPLPSLTWWEWKLKTAPQLLKFSWVPSLPVPWCLPTVTPFPLLQTGSPSGTRCCLGFHFLLGLHSLQSSFLTCPQKYPPQKL